MTPTTRQEFVKKYSPFVNSITRGTGIFSGTLLAQAVLESSGNWNTSGQWLVGGSKLSQKANNLFGIKASKDWKGETYNISTGEFTPTGQAFNVNADFRKYASAEDSIKDYVNFLLTNPRYKKGGVFTAPNVMEQAIRLKNSGYATAPNYADIVNSVYESIKKYISTKTIIGAGAVFLLIGGFFLYRYLK